MDRIGQAADRLWGPLDSTGRLNAAPRFADELAVHVNNKLAVRDSRVSKWSYGHQLEHLYRTSHYVLDRLEESMTGRNREEHMGMWGAGLMVGGFIPRYWFPTIPPLEPLSGTEEHIQPLKDKLKERLATVEWRYEQIKASRGRSLHPRMKYLTSSQWLYFQHVHHRHHLSIMRDILKAAG